MRPFCRNDAHFQPYVSVNLSAPALASPGIVESIRVRLIQYNMDPSELRIELTETMIIQNMEAASSAVQQLRNLGTAWRWTILAPAMAAWIICKPCPSPA